MCGVLVGLCDVAAPRAQSLAQMPPPVFEVERIRIEGYLGAPSPGAATTNLTLGYKGEIYRLQLTRLQVLFGNVLYPDILADVQPYRPNFILYGPPGELGKLAAARPGEPIEITGTIHAGGRSVLVQSLRVGPPGSP
jgi:hypothetical protein